MKRFITSLGFILIASGCKTTADTNYELNRRSGLSYGQDMKKQSYDTKQQSSIKDLKVSKTNPVASNIPTLKAPSVEKVWLNSQQIDEKTWLQGTWLYFQVGKAEWVPAKNR